MKSIHEWHYQHYTVTTDITKLDTGKIHDYLTHSAWAEGSSRELVNESILNSLCFGLFAGTEQIGFARVVTDGVTFGYLCDVYIIDEYQKQGLGRWLMECCQSHPVMNRLRRIMLVTSSAPWLYEKSGYSPINRENYIWQIVRPDIYKQ
ncbi:GNAT family N-acetyltransferase [Morganella morganii]|uniref:GNAT family N-acetyltransferase n=1 Tax=Morganella morganii TaxID=582 RepID=UPI0034D624C9